MLFKEEIEEVKARNPIMPKEKGNRVTDREKSIRIAKPDLR